MPAARFARFVLRTTDVAAASAFYEAVLGHRGDHVYPLHEQALARGARPHWLGHLDAAEPSAAAAPLLARGGQQLGERPDGVVVMKDPGGALLALGGVSEPSRAGVVWHVLRAPQAEGLLAQYAELFGWALGEQLELGGTLYRTFAWEAGAPACGVAGELSAGVHAQWLHFFAVASVDATAARVRERGGRAVEPAELSQGMRLAVCEDPQGAAFGIVQTSPRSA